MDMHRLINEVRQRPALWDANHPEHANRVETQRQWRCVADALGAKVELCRSKWKNLRCSYRRQQHRRHSFQQQQQQQQQQPQQQQTSPTHQWSYAEAMSFLDGCRLRTDSSNNEDDDCELSAEVEDTLPFKAESMPSDEMEADNDALMEEFQSMTTPQALRRLSHSISLASAAAEEQVVPPSLVNPSLPQGTAAAAAAASGCQCAKRVDEQVNFLENLEREEQQLMQSTSQDLARCKNVLHVGDSDYNFLVSFLPLMKQMSPMQNVSFRARMGELLLQTMQQSPMQLQQPQQQQQQQQPQPSQMLLNQQQMALDQAQQQVSTSTSSTNWN
ncbi:putative mediator of RNA polymerase II transcription subunit 26 [Drosophila innubila]|uniref:putative mediator of RNA polymerase II transcription subunit 26 n=1 Tax=Drosophila innubila TaxID=198719 RepID=UPI00148CE7CF|nr:putative mediator of RNA polymerase II transcription subunit 26 [Drosophila innubila]